MSWIRENSDPPWFHRFCLNVLRTGKIPRHVAFIMDGNRRFAREKCIEKMEGHSQGFEKLAETLEWCRQLGITEVTVYAFSIENFKRSKQEVECLMELAEKKFDKLAEEKDNLDKYGICVQVLGDLAMLPQSLQQKIAKVVCMTKDNREARLNVCMPYTSHDEITKAIQEIAEGVKQGLLLESDVNEELIEQCLMTNKSADPDLLVRTSGEVRLSDFLLWQSAYSILSFVKVMWPEYSIWHLYAGVLHYQMNYNAIQAARTDMLKQRKETDVLNDTDQSYSYDQNSDQDEKYAKLKAARLERTEKFLQYVDEKRSRFIENLCCSHSEKLFDDSNKNSETVVA